MKINKFLDLKYKIITCINLKSIEINIIYSFLFKNFEYNK